MDKISKSRRRANMRAIKSKNTSPELAVRRLAYSLGYRFRLHKKDLPGKPDLVFPARRKVIFVHGCFWHQHIHCADSHIPRSNFSYWEPKLKNNKKRDAKNKRALKALQWDYHVIWECETGNTVRLSQRLKKFLSHYHPD